MRYRRAKVTSSGSGNVTLWTASNGKRAYINAVSVYNTSGGSLSYFLNWLIGGTHYKLNTALSVGAGASGQVATSVVIILEPGESLTVNVTGSGLNIRARVVEYDSSVRLYAPKKYSGWSSGDNTLYTVPTGYDAALLDGVGMLAQNTTSFNYFNASGGSVNNKWHNVPSGSSPATDNEVSATTATANDARLTHILSSTMEEGDFINVNVNSASNTQIAWIIVAEKANV